jgi:N-acetylmuramoyl-L-alanine amidase
MKKYFTLVFLFLILAACFLTTDRSIKVMESIFFMGEQANDKQITIVIDPGHGGRDPGKVGVNNSLEKDINLSIAYKLKNLLELNDIKVIMTREDDTGLYNETDSSKKMADLLNRVELIHNSKADLAISIHQNSFTQEQCRGAQTFYYSSSGQGKQLAELIQEQLKETLADGNHRVAKQNNNYYMLKKSKVPLVIVECGYLSNVSEAELLLNEDYQEKVAWGIHLAILQFINEGGLDSGIN